MSLGLRLILLILLAAVPVFLVQVTHEFQLREYRRVRVLDNAQVLAGLTAARLDRAVEGAQLPLTAASRLQSVRTRDSEACSRVLRELVEKIPDLTAMAVLSTAGDRWCVSVTDTGPINLADRPYFQATVRSSSFQSSDYIVGRQTGRGSIAFTYPVLGDGGTVEDVIFVAYSTDTFSGMLDDPVLTEGAFVALLDRNGVVGARWPEADKWVGRDLSASDVARRAIANRRGVTAATEDWAGAGEYAFAFAPMHPPANLTVLVGVPLTAALRDFEMLFWEGTGLDNLGVHPGRAACNGRRAFHGRQTAARAPRFCRRIGVRRLPVPAIDAGAGQQGAAISCRPLRDRRPCPRKASVATPRGGAAERDLRRR